MATVIIKEIDSYSSRYHFKVGITFFIFLIIIFLLFKYTNYNKSVPFVATFNYIEGVNKDTEVNLAGIKVGGVNKIMISSDEVIIKGYIDKLYDIPEDSILKIKSDGIFGKKILFIEAGFGKYFDKSNQYVFNQTQDSYSIDMFLRYLSEMNE